MPTNNTPIETINQPTKGQSALRELHALALRDSEWAEMERMYYELREREQDQQQAA